MLLEMEENGKVGLCLVSCRDDGLLNWSGESIWGDFKCLHDDLTYSLWGEGGKILKVYDRPHYNKGAHLLSTEDRTLLWKREDKHTPEVGDVYEGSFPFVITKVNDCEYTRLFDDGSGGAYPIEKLDEFKFTGRNIKEELQYLLDEIEE